VTQQYYRQTANKTKLCSYLTDAFLFFQCVFRQVFASYLHLQANNVLFADID